MQITQRQVTLSTLAVLTAGCLLITITFLFSDAGLLLPIAVGGSVVFVGLLGAYWRGWEPARYLAVIFVTLMIAGTIGNPQLIDRVNFIPLLAVSIAASMLPSAWVVGAAVVVLVPIVVRMTLPGSEITVSDLILFVMITAGIVLARLVGETAQRHAEAQADRAETAQRHAEAQSAELSARAEELATQNDEQRRLIDLVSTLETPAVSLAAGVILAPVVGHLDSRRADLLTTRLLHEVGAYRARLVILDIAGVSAVDSGVAQALLRTIQAVRLLGCEVTVTGISAAVASTMTGLGISMAGVRTARTPQEALEAVTHHTPVRKG